MVAPDHKGEWKKICRDCQQPMVLSNDLVGVPRFSGADPLDLGRVVELSAFVCPACGLTEFYSARVLRGEPLIS